MSKKSTKKNTRTKKSTIPDLNSVNGFRGKRYVFFQTLSYETAEQYEELNTYAHSIINSFSSSLAIKDNTHDKNGDRMNQALSFLKNAAEFERQKELQFFQHFETSHPEIKEIFNITSTQGIINDYEGFIVNINRAIKGTNEFKSILQTEIKRIQKNNADAKSKYNTIETLTKQQQEQYENDLREQRNNALFLTANGETIFNNIFYERSQSWHKLNESIILKYGKDLFTFENNRIKLSAHQVMSAIALLSMHANEIFLTQIKKEQPNVSMEDSIDQILDNPKYAAYVKNLLNNPDIFSTLTSIANQYGLSTDEDIKTNSKKVKDLEASLFEMYKNTNKNSKYKNSKDWLESIGLDRNQLNAMFNSVKPVSAQLYYTSEDISVADLITNHISAVLGGGANPTDDIEAGALITDMNYDPRRLATLERQLWKSQREHFKKVKATSNLESFQENTKELLKAREEQEKLLERFSKQIQSEEKTMTELLKHINIHSTVKAYTSAGSSMFEARGGFGGAAFGSNLFNEIDILADVGNAGGLAFSKEDKEDFIMAMINAGQEMIGNSLKPQLENYFSTFIGLLMFNDAEIAAFDIQKWIQNNKELQSSVQDLHLYQLNGVLVPSSYILEKTYEALAPLPNEIQTNTRGLSLHLITYDKGPINHNWDLTAATAIEKTKFERMHFLAGFFDFIDELNSRMANIF